MGCCLLATAWRCPASSPFFTKGCERSSPSLAAAASTWNAQHFICSKIFITSFSSQFTVLYVMTFDSACGNIADTKGEKVIIFLTYVPYTYPKTVYYCISFRIVVSLSSFLRSDLREMMYFCTIIVSEFHFWWHSEPFSQCAVFQKSLEILIIFVI